ncbi:hypothetical protein CTI12_AA042060 [Artemisia annua]|uniref:Uncharacterized protein n=1 Tax=Artemisia annua TaxID=35608 RepID=A0A2U1QE07_ARTAN|nr:hypothetical protein CTI12_AA042060 [Artemisia annua]
MLMSSCDGTEVREESHDQNTNILPRVVDQTTPPAPEGETIREPTPVASLAPGLTLGWLQRLRTRPSEKPLLGRRYLPMQPKRKGGQEELWSRVK